MIFKALVTIGKNLTPGQRLVVTGVLCSTIFILWYFLQGHMLIKRYHAYQNNSASRALIDQLAQPGNPTPKATTLAQLTHLAHATNLSIIHAHDDPSLITVTVTGSSHDRIHLLQQLALDNVAIENLLMTDSLLSLSLIRTPPS